MLENSQDEIGSWRDYYWLSLSKQKSLQRPRLFPSSQRKDIPVSMVSRGNDFEQMHTIECHLLEQAFGARYLIPSASHTDNLAQSA